MIPLSKLRTAAREALAYVRAQADVAQAEVFASANTNLTVRINYTSHIPSNGVEEPKSVESFGLGLRVAFHPSRGSSRSNSSNKVTTGYGSEPTDHPLPLEFWPSTMAVAKDMAKVDSSVCTRGM